MLGILLLMDQVYLSTRGDSFISLHSKKITLLSVEAAETILQTTDPNKFID